MSNRTQQEMKRRNLKIVDETAKIDVTLWNNDAEEFNEDKMRNSKKSCYCLKGCKVSPYGGMKYISIFALHIKILIFLATALAKRFYTISNVMYCVHKVDIKV